jgi:hypothetical protein
MAVRWVTKAQVAAAQLAIDLSIELGEEPDELMVKIANATPLSRKKWEAEQAAKMQQADADAKPHADAGG